MFAAQPTSAPPGSPPGSLFPLVSASSPTCLHARTLLLIRKPDAPDYVIPTTGEADAITELLAFGVSAASNSCKDRSKHDPAMATSLKVLQTIASIRMAGELELELYDSKGEFKLATRGRMYKTIKVILKPLGVLINSNVPFASGYAEQLIAQACFRARELSATRLHCLLDKYHNLNEAEKKLKNYYRLNAIGSRLLGRDNANVATGTQLHNTLVEVFAVPMKHPCYADNLVSFEMTGRTYRTLQTCLHPATPFNPTTPVWTLEADATALSSFSSPSYSAFSPGQTLEDTSQSLTLIELELLMLDNQSM